MLTSAVVLGIMLGLVLGKPIGIWVASYLAVKGRLVDRPASVPWTDLLGMGATAGIGFTVALFVAELAFKAHPDLLREAKVGILAASVLAGLLGQLLLRLDRPSPEEAEMVDAEPSG